MIKKLFVVLALLAVTAICIKLQKHNSDPPLYPRYKINDQRFNYQGNSLITNIEIRPNMIEFTGCNRFTSPYFRPGGYVIIKKFYGIVYNTCENDKDNDFKNLMTSVYNVQQNPFGDLTFFDKDGNKLIDLFRINNWSQLDQQE